MNRLIPRLYLNFNGLAMLLGGESQARVFCAVLEYPGILRRVMETVNDDPAYEPIAYTTVATIANKLCDKGILKRTKIDGAKVEYVYRAEYTEDELIALCIDTVMIRLREEYPEYISRACFVHVNQKDLKTK